MAGRSSMHTALVLCDAGHHVTDRQWTARYAHCGEGSQVGAVHDGPASRANRKEDNIAVETVPRLVTNGKYHKECYVIGGKVVVHVHIHRPTHLNVLSGLVLLLLGICRNKVAASPAELPCRGPPLA